MSLGPAKAIIFDLGKVLIDFSVDRACSQVAALVDSSPQKVHEFLFADGREFDFERGLISFSDLHRQFESYFETSVLPAALKHAASDIFNPLPETLNILSSIHTRYQGSRPIILLSNTNEIHWEHIERNWSISRWFDDLVLSFEIKSMKPDKKIYLEAVSKSGHKAGECFFVDDVPANVEGAKKCGIDAVLFENSAKLTHDLKLRGISID
jgi:putative hydrolase of the HAD superfamily